AEWQGDQARHRPPAQVEGDQHPHGPVERIVTGRLPADRMADDDRGTIDSDRQLPHRGPAETLGFELAPFVGVAEALADVELALEDDVGTITGDVGRTDVIEAPLLAVLPDPATEQERLSGPADVPAPRLGERTTEVRRRRDMDDAVDPLRERGVVGRRETETCLRHVALHDADAFAVRAGQPLHQLPAAPLEGEVVARADERDHVGLTVAGKEASDYLAPKTARRPGDQRDRHAGRWGLDLAARPGPTTCALRPVTGSRGAGAHEETSSRGGHVTRLLPLPRQRRSPGQSRWTGTRQPDRPDPVDSMAFHQRAHLFDRDAGVLRRMLDAALVATELSEQVEPLEHREGALVRHPKGKIEVFGVGACWLGDDPRRR